MPSVTAAAAADFAFAVVVVAAAGAASVLVIDSTFPWLTSRSSSNFPGAGCCPHRCCSRWPGY